MLQLSRYPEGCLRWRLYHCDGQTRAHLFFFVSSLAQWFPSPYISILDSLNKSSILCNRKINNFDRNGCGIKVELKKCCRKNAGENCFWNFGVLSDGGELIKKPPNMALN